MSLDTLTQLVRAKAKQNPSLGHTAMFDLGDMGVIYWDGTVSPAIIDNMRRDAEAVLKLSADLMEKMLDGGINPTMAYMTGKLKISGSTGVALKINSFMDE